jgi:hypothetical protein
MASSCSPNAARKIILSVSQGRCSDGKAASRRGQGRQVKQMRAIEDQPYRPRCIDRPAFQNFVCEGSVKK